MIYFHVCSCVSVETDVPICIKLCFTLLLHIIMSFWSRHAVFSSSETYTEFPEKQTGFGYGKSKEKIKQEA